MSNRPFDRDPADSVENDVEPAERAAERHLSELRIVLEDAADLTARCTFDQFAQSRPLQNEARGIVVHLREVINRLPDHVTAAHPDIPWRQITGMGNVVAHEYDLEVDWQIVWNTLSRRAPDLHRRLNL